MQKDLSPIVLFTYNRPLHTKRTLEAIKKNELSLQSDLIVYSDGPKNESDLPDVEKVREYARNVIGFKSVKIIEREQNWGLAKSIIDGVTTTVQQYGTVIVLEDDIVTAPCFLNYMNDALRLYQHEKKVWHISGWNYPIECHNPRETFLWRAMNCWGWGTWDDRWQHFTNNIDYFISSFSKKEINRFNLDGHEDFWEQVIANKNGKIETWAIFWYATIFVHKGLCLNPVQTFVRNTGHDGSGTHCRGKSITQAPLNLSEKVNFPDQLIESEFHLRLIQQVTRSQRRTKTIIRKLFRKLF